RRAVSLARMAVLTASANWGFSELPMKISRVKRLILMEVSAAGGQAIKQTAQIHQTVGDQMSSVLMALPNTINPHQLGSQQFGALAFSQLRANNDIDVA